MKRIYLDYAASAPVRNEVIWEMQRAFYDYGNPSSLHRSGRTARARVEMARQQVADLIGAEPGQIIFTSGGTEANNTIINAYDKIAVSAIEHPSILAPAECKKARIIPVDQSGKVKMDELKKALSGGVELVSIMLVNNEIGTLQDIVKITTLAHKYNCLVHTDATQALGKTPIDVDKLNIDFMTISAHKIGGPKGVGAIYARDSVIKPFSLGGHQESNRRAGTENVVSIVGFGVAATLVGRYMPKFDKDVRAHRDNLRDFIVDNIDDVTVNTPADAVSNILNVSFAGAEGESILLELDARGIEVSTGSACATGDIRSSHVLMAIGADPELAHGSIRFSLGPDITAADIDQVIAKLPLVIEKLRKMSTVKAGK